MADLLWKEEEEKELIQQRKKEKLDKIIKQRAE